MEWLSLAKVITGAAAWRIFGMDRGGRVLIDALSSPDENVRVIAGMLLVKGGQRALPLLREALKGRSALVTVLTIIADVGDKRVVRDIEPFLSDDDPQVRKAARVVLEVLGGP